MTRSSTVTPIEPFNGPSAQVEVMLAVPALTPVTTPAALTVAVPVAELAKEIEPGVTKRAEPSAAHTVEITRRTACSFRVKLAGFRRTACGVVPKDVLAFTVFEPVPQKSSTWLVVPSSVPVPPAAAKSRARSSYTPGVRLLAMIWPVD